ncbi:MAG: VOC family protein [Flavipsychrobacter sp.]
MSSKIGGLRTTVYKVPDMDAAKKWYSETFGITPYFDEPFYVGFNVGGYELGLHPEGEESMGERTANVYTYWAVDNVEEMYAYLLNNGATELEKPTDVGEGIILAAVKDPWGNALGIIDNPHFNIVE